MYLVKNMPYSQIIFVKGNKAVINGKCICLASIQYNSLGVSRSTQKQTCIFTEI